MAPMLQQWALDFFSYSSGKKQQQWKRSSLSGHQYSKTAMLISGRKPVSLPSLGKGQIDLPANPKQAYRNF